MADFQHVKDVLLANTQVILNLLGNEFDSNDFIRAFKDLFPLEYAAALLEAKTYQSLHVWISNEILNKAYSNLINQIDSHQRLSCNANTTVNKIWKKI